MHDKKLLFLSKLIDLCEIIAVLTTFNFWDFNFEENKEWKFEGKLAAVLDFYADWCGHVKWLPLL